MSNPIETLQQRLSETGQDYLALGPLGGAEARVDFPGTFRGKPVVWHARIIALRHPDCPLRPLPDTQFMEIAPAGPSHASETPDGDGPMQYDVVIGLWVAAVDHPTVLKTLVMMRKYRRLREGRIEFRPASMME